MRVIWWWISVFNGVNRRKVYLLAYWHVEKVSRANARAALKTQKQLKLHRSVRIEPTTAPFVEMAVSSASMYF